jgi:hypothetical protein
MPKPENLIPHKFKKGYDPKRAGNGRPHKLPALDELMAKVMGEMGESGLSAMEAILKAQRAKAAKGDSRAAELLLDRAYGKPKQHTDITTKGESMTQTPDLSKLSEDELKQMAAINRKIRE